MASSGWHGDGAAAGDSAGSSSSLSRSPAGKKKRLQGEPGWKNADGATANGAGGGAGTPRPRDAGADRLLRGASRVVAPGRDRPPGPDGGAVDAAAVEGGAVAVDGGASDRGGKRPRVLSLVLDGAPWYASQSTQGIAADAQGKVYVADGAHIFMVDGAAVSTYLPAAEAAAGAEAGASSPGIGDLDIGPDGRLYFVTYWSSTTTGARLGVMRSSQPHVAQPWIDVAPTTMDVGEIAVIDDGVIALVSRTGFWTFSDAGGKLIYAPSLVGTQGCADEDLAAGPSGTFLYQPGCNGSSLLRGQADGSGVGVLYPSSLLGSSDIAANNFLCVARDPSGGFYLAVDDPTDDEPRLYHVADDAQGTSGLTWIETAPSFAQASQQKSDVFGFDFCSLATAPDGTVYFQSYAQLWKVSP